jgi:uncharacterized protein YuzE
MVDLFCSKEKIKLGTISPCTGRVIKEKNTAAFTHWPGGETMKVTYDPEVDVLRIVFRDIDIEESDEEKPGMILDYDKDGNIVGMEILDASKRVENPRSVEYAVAG